MRFIKLGESFTLSFPIHRESPLRVQMRFRLAGRNDEMKKSCLGVILPDQVEGDVKDAVYPTGIALSRKDGIPNQVGNDITDKVY